jgi:hypothetical protein
MIRSSHKTRRSFQSCHSAHQEDRSSPDSLRSSASLLYMHDRRPLFQSLLPVRAASSQLPSSFTRKSAPFVTSERFAALTSTASFLSFPLLPILRLRQFRSPTKRSLLRLRPRRTQRDPANGATDITRNPRHSGCVRRIDPRGRGSARDARAPEAACAAVVRVPAAA